MFKNVQLGFNSTFILKAHSYDALGSKTLPADWHVSIISADISVLSFETPPSVVVSPLKYKGRLLD